MKSCTAATLADTELDLRCLSISSLHDEVSFATAPMLALSPAFTRSGETEEELYTSFEEAISERVAHVSRQLSSLPLAVQPGPTTSHARVVRRARGGQVPQRALTLFCLGLSLMLVGFDLMGLLIIMR